MASVKHLGGNKYKVTISAGFNDDGTRNRIFKTITAKDEEEACKKANKLEGQVEKGNYTKPTHMTFVKYVEAWKKDVKKDLADKTYHRYCEMLDLRIIKALGKIKMEKLNPVVIKKFYSELREPMTLERKYRSGKTKQVTVTLSDQSVKHHHRLISTILQSAYKDGIIKENPCSRIDAPKVDKENPPEYDADQISALIEALEDVELKFKVFMHIALAGGLRLGEICGLEWQDINYDNRSIEIKRSSQYLPGKGIFTKKPKNKTSERIVILPSPVMDLIGQLEHEQKLLQIKLGNKWIGKDFKDEKSNGRLFTTEFGGPIHPHTPSKWFHDFIRGNDLLILTVHDLRHISASYLIAAGQDVVAVSKRLGHSNTSTTLNTYAHAFKKRDEESANKMEGLYTKKEKKEKKDSKAN